MLSTNAEVDTRPDDEVLDHAEKPILLGFGQRPDHGGDTEGQTAEIITAEIITADFALRRATLSPARQRGRGTVRPSRPSLND